MARDELWDGLRDWRKEQHDKRVAKNPDRIAYAISQFEKNGILYELKNPQICHFHIWDKNGKLYQFWAGTGKILGKEQGGIHNLLKIIKKGEKINGKLD